MNCQAFRKAWLDDTNISVFAHIETCEECMAWIEKQMTTDEEVQFLKEVPLPSVILEERIMQAVYQNTGQGTPPHASTGSLQSLRSPKTNASSKRRTKGFPSFAMVSAAAVLLIAGLVGYKQLQSGEQELASQPQSSASSVANQDIAFSTQAQPKLEAADAPVKSSDTASNKPAAAATGAGTQQPKAEKSAMASTPSAATTASTATPSAAQVPSAMSESALAINDVNTKPAKSVSPESRSAQTQAHPTARYAGTKQHVGESENKQAVALTDSTSESKTASAADQAAAAAGEPVYALTAQTLTGSNQTETAESFAGPPLPTVEKAEITLSSFADVDTAVQASDMPVPVLNQSTNGFTVSDISVQYESETSQKVTQLTAEYKRSKSWIKINVVSNSHGKRSLSIPGTFAATQLFTVGSEQAIGVTFDQKGAKEASAQHAVYFNAQADNQSLYVVMTGHGISLNELIETAKLMTWE